MPSAELRKVTLIQPSTMCSYTVQRQALPPLGVLTLATALRRRGYDVEIIDGIYEGFESRVPVDREFFLLGLTPSAMAERALATGAGVVGFSILFEAQEAVAVAAARHIKEAAPDVLIVFGGPFITLRPEKVMEDPAVDAVVLSEADVSFPDLLDELSANGRGGEVPPGTGIRTNGEWTLDRNFKVVRWLDELGMPSRDLIDVEGYSELNREFLVLPKSFPATTIQTSRGCHLRCTFCTSKLIHTRKYRAFSPERVIAEIDHLVDTYGIRELQIIDENFTANPRRAEAICDLLIERDYGLSWYMMAGTYVMSLNERLIEKMVRAGLYKLKVSFESGSERVLREVIDKPIDLAYGKRMINHAQSLGIPVGSAFVIGFPWETRAEILESFEFAKDVGFDYTYWSLADPMPHTEFTERAIREGLLRGDYHENYVETIGDHAHFDLKDVTREELLQMRRDFWQELHFSDPERERRYHSFQVMNEGYAPTVRPKSPDAFTPLANL